MIPIMAALVSSHVNFERIAFTVKSHSKYTARFSTSSCLAYTIKNCATEPFSHLQFDVGTLMLRSLGTRSLYYVVWCNKSPLSVTWIFLMAKGHLLCKRILKQGLPCSSDLSSKPIPVKRRIHRGIGAKPMVSDCEESALW